MNSGKILFVYDSASFGNLCVEALGLAGYSVDAASNKAEAGELLETSIYDLIISEVSSPGLAGISFYRETIKKYQYLEKKFLFIADDPSKEVLTALANARRKYLVKPFKISKLVEMAGRFASKSAKNRPARKEARLDWRVDCVLSSFGSDKKIIARSKDVSKSGILVEYGGRALDAQAQVKISIELNGFVLSREATVVWSRHTGPHEAASGLLFKRSIDLTQIAFFSEHAGRALSN